MKHEGTVTGSIVGAGAGAAAFWIATQAAQRISWLQGKWWAAPAAMLAAGHVVKFKAPAAGQAVVGAAGLMLAFSYYVQASQPKPQQASGLEPRFYGAPGPVQGVPLSRGEVAGAIRGPTPVRRFDSARARTVETLALPEARGYSGAGALQSAQALTITRPVTPLSIHDPAPRALRALVPVTTNDRRDSIARALEAAGGSRAGGVGRGDPFAGSGPLANMPNASRFG